MPLDGHLGDGDVQLFGEEQNFDVEYPRGEMLVGEDELCGAAGEKLESALCVSDVADTNDAENGVQAVH